MSHCLEIQVARCPPDTAELLRVANFSRKGEGNVARSSPRRWCAGEELGTSLRAVGQGASACGACPRGGICSQLGPSPCPPLGVGGEPVVTAAPKHSLPSCFWLPWWWLARSSKKDPCRPLLRTAGEMLLWVLPVPKAFISWHGINLRALPLAVPLRPLDRNLRAKHKRTMLL